MTVLDIDAPSSPATPAARTQAPSEWLPQVKASLKAHTLVPYMGSGMLSLIEQPGVPATPEALVALLVAKATVPHKIRNRLTQAAQFIENFKHRKTVVTLMNEAFANSPEPSAFHQWVAACGAPLLIESWYDDTLSRALSQGLPAGQWGQVQGQSQSEYFGQWVAYFDAHGVKLDAPDPSWQTLLYRPIGGHTPAANYLVSDSDYVEVLTEIDIQTPIPEKVQQLRSGRHFLFMGCRFNDQLSRSFARQIMKRSSSQHWAVLPETPTRMEERFLQENNITRIDLPLSEVAALLMKP
jgi:SIR2-like domain